MAALKAVVKSVVSGDTIVLRNPNGTQERTLSLAYISAPRLRREGDEVPSTPTKLTVLLTIYSRLLSNPENFYVNSS